MTNTNSHVHCDHCDDVSERCPECGVTENGKCRHWQNNEINRLRGMLKDAQAQINAFMDGADADCGEPGCPDCAHYRGARTLSAKLAKELDR